MSLVLLNTPLLLLVSFDLIHHQFTICGHYMHYCQLLLILLFCGLLFLSAPGSLCYYYYCYYYYYVDIRVVPRQREALTGLMLRSLSSEVGQSHCPASLHSQVPSQAWSPKRRISSLKQVTCTLQWNALSTEYLINTNVNLLIKITRTDVLLSLLTQKWVLTLHSEHNNNQHQMT